jgi:hypothetical protein
VSGYSSLLSLYPEKSSKYYRVHGKHVKKVLTRP